MTDYQTEVLIDAGHPSLPGHFPGRPVVPGVVILDEVLQALSQWQPHLRVLGFTTVKFLQPLLPNETFRIEFTAAKAERVKFDCTRQDSVIASGVINVDTQPQET